MSADRKEKQLKELFAKYLNGTASEAESKQVEEWYRLFDDTDGPGTPFSSPDEEEAEHKLILGNLHSQIQVAGDTYVAPKRFAALRLKVAAVAAVFLMLAGSLYYYHAATNTVPEIVKINTAIADAGKMKLIELADGSKIWLNSSSKLTYPERFSDSVREVSLLEGEAFFEIAHENKRPFIVHSKGINTQVLGTSFNINAYKYSKNIAVTVSTGKVAVSAGRSLIDYLTPKEQIKYELLTGKILKANVINSESPWMHGDIVLDQVDFESLKAILFDNYRYVLKSKNKKVTGLHFSATLKKTDEISNVIKLLSAINHTKYTLIQNEITMY